MPQPRRAALPISFCATLLLGTTLPPPAMATPGQDDRSQAVQQELQDWFQAQLGSGLIAGALTVQLRPEGDGYALTAPLGPDAATTGHLTLQPDGRWRLSGVKLPSPSSITTSIPVPTRSDRPADATASTTEFSVARQETDGILDPSYKTPSSTTQSFEAYQTAGNVGELRRVIQIAHSMSQTTLAPASKGRLDAASESTANGLSMSVQGDTIPSVHATADRVRTTNLLSGVSRERGPRFTRDLAALIAECNALGTTGCTDPAQLTEGQRTQLRSLLDDLDDLASGEQGDIDLKNVQVQSDEGFNGVAQRLHVSLSGEAPGGVLNSYLDLSAEGLSFPGLPASPYADLVPTSVHIRPVLAGIGTKDLLLYARGLLDAADQGQSARPDPAPLLTHGVVVGLDAVSFNLGPTLFDGHGKVTITAPDAFTGSGQVTATDLDALIDRARQAPQMQTAFVVLTIAKGIGRADGNQTVWDITCRDGKALVNGVDIMAMAGAAARPHAPDTPVKPPEQ